MIITEPGSSGHLVAAATPGGGGGGNGSVLARGRADTKSALDLGHERDMRGSSHLVKLMFRVAPTLSGGVWVGECGFVSTSNTVLVLAVKATVVVVARGGGGGNGSAATSEERHDSDLVG